MKRKHPRKTAVTEQEGFLNANPHWSGGGVTLDWTGHLRHPHLPHLVTKPAPTGGVLSYDWSLPMMIKGLVMMMRMMLTMGAKK